MNILRSQHFSTNLRFDFIKRFRHFNHNIFFNTKQEFEGKQFAKKTISQQRILKYVEIIKMFLIFLKKANCHW